MENFIEKETLPFRQFSPDYIYNHAKLGPDDIIIRVQNDKVGIIKGEEKFDINKKVNIRLKVIANSLANAWDRNPKNLDVVVPLCLSDKSETPYSHIPHLVFSKESYSNNILMPSLNNLIGYREFAYVDQYDYPLFHKIPKMRLAASLTNIYWNNHGIEYNQRLRIGDLGAIYSDRFEIDIIRPPKFKDKEWEEVAPQVKKYFPDLYASGGFVNEYKMVPIQDQLKFKYQLCIDGHTCPWARLPWQMYSNSIPIRIRNPQDRFIEWFYHLLEPNRHYLEANEDTLIDLYNYIEKEPDLQLYVATEGKKFVEEYLSVEKAEDFLLSTLLQMSKNQKIPEE